MQPFRSAIVAAALVACIASGCKAAHVASSQALENPPNGAATSAAVKRPGTPAVLASLLDQYLLLDPKAGDQSRRKDLTATLARFDWSPAAPTDAVFDAIKRLQQSTHAGYDVMDADRLPDPFLLAAPEAWAAEIAQRLDHMGGNMTVRHTAWVPLQAVTERVVDALAPHWDDDKLLSVNRQFATMFFGYYDNYYLWADSSNYPDAREFFVWGARLGDVRAFMKAKELAEEFAAYKPNVFQRGFDQLSTGGVGQIDGVLRALQAFATNAPTFAAERDALVQKILATGRIPAAMRQRLGLP